MSYMLNDMAIVLDYKASLELHNDYKLIYLIVSDCDKKGDKLRDEIY